MTSKERKAMDEARRVSLEEQLPIGVSYADAQYLFEDGWKAAIEWKKEQRK